MSVLVPGRRRLAALAIVTGVGIGQAIGAAGPVVSGKYLGNGKPAQLAFARIVPHEDWEGAKAWTLVISEKDVAKVDKPDFDAMFGELGHALVVGLNEKGSIFSVQVCHQALEKSGLSSSGTLSIEGFTIAGGKLSARFFTTKEEEFFGDRWEIDLKVTDAPLPAK
jgi:hypothetical protein